MLTDEEKAIRLGKNIAAARKKKHLSQNALSEILNVSREHLAKIETAKRGISLGLLFELSRVLNVNESELFKFK